MRIPEKEVLKVGWRGRHSTKWRVVKQALPSILIICMSLFLLFHFGCLWVHGEFVIEEQSKVVLTLETGVVTAILSYGIYLFIERVRR